MTEVTVLGAGPAGSSAAIAALHAGAAVRIFEKSAFPRHKVCGEFLSPGVAPLIERLGGAKQFAAARPHRVTRFALHFPRYTKHGLFAEAGLGLSRYRLDQILLDLAIEAGAKLEREPAPERANPPVVIATGRRFQGKRGGRLFGFKAHFTGPPDDSVELFFFDGCYVGINCVEAGITNVCGVGPEEALTRHGFEPDSLTATFAPLRDRVSSLERSLPWLTTGPLYFRDRLNDPPQPGQYPAGDQVSFVDPFTGSGILSALVSGPAAGQAAATGRPPAEYLRETARKLRPALRVSATFRWAIEAGVAERVLRWMPPSWLVGWTRPR